MTSSFQASIESLAKPVQAGIAATMPAMRVLVVEDEPEVAGSLARGLAEAGISV